MGVRSISYINRGNRPPRSGFGEGIAEAAVMNPSLIALGADITASVGMNLFAKEFPDRFFSLGIAEQNCVGVAAGLALSGKIPVFSTYGVFAAMRTTDHLRVSICFNNLHVIIGGAHAGISVGPDGATHQALEDIAVMRVLPNMTVLSPCDATQVKLMTMLAVSDINGPVYIRFGREAVPDFTSPDQTVKVGRGQLMVNGKDVSIIATGNMVWQALVAASDLEKQGISARVINIHTIKPIDTELIVAAARETACIVTAEEHQQIGGLGSAVAEIVAMNCPVPMAFVGMKDCFGESGLPTELMEKYGLTADAISESVKKLLKGI